MLLAARDAVRFATPLSFPEFEDDEQQIVRRDDDDIGHGYTLVRQAAEWLIPRMAEAKWGGAMRNTTEIEGYRAVIQFDPDIDMFRGEFVGLNEGADFYARDIAGLRREGAASLKVFLEMCEEDGVEPRKQFSGGFNVRLPTVR